MKKKLVGIIAIIAMFTLMVPGVVFASDDFYGISVTGTEGVDYEYQESYTDDEGYEYLPAIVILKNGVTVSGTATNDLDIMIGDGVTDLTVKDLDQSDVKIFVCVADDYTADEFTLTVDGDNSIHSIYVEESSYNEYEDVYEFASADPLTIKGSDKTSDCLAIDGMLYNDARMIVENVTLDCYCGMVEYYDEDSDAPDEYYRRTNIYANKLTIEDSIVKSGPIDTVVGIDITDSKVNVEGGLSAVEYEYDEYDDEYYGTYYDISIDNSEITLEGEIADDPDDSVYGDITCRNIDIKNSTVDTILGGLYAYGAVAIDDSEMSLEEGIFAVEYDTIGEVLDAYDLSITNSTVYADWGISCGEATINNSDIELTNGDLRAAGNVIIENDSDVEIAYALSAMLGDEDNVYDYYDVTVSASKISVGSKDDTCKLAGNNITIKENSTVESEGWIYSFEDIMFNNSTVYAYDGIIADGIGDLTVKNTELIAYEGVEAWTVRFEGSTKAKLASTPFINESGDQWIYWPLYSNETTFALSDINAYVEASIPSNYNNLAICASEGFEFADGNIIETGGSVFYYDYEELYTIGNNGVPAKMVKIIYEGAPADVTRLYGGGRIETSIGAANQLKEELGGSRFENVVVATAYNFADALPGSYVAAAEKAPILLIDEDYAGTITDYINRNMKNSGNVYILGGEGVVPSEWLEDVNGNLVRLGGSNRYGTNLEILKEIPVKNTDTVMVCTGMNFADSLSASATGNPILLADDGLTAEQIEYLESIEGCDFCMIGGEGAVPPAIADAIAEYDGDGEVDRAAGATRFETSKAVADKFISDKNPKDAVLAYGYNFPDGLSGGPLAYAMGAPLLLTASDLATEYTPAKTYVANEKIESGYVLGGTALVSDKTVRTIYGLGAKVRIPAVFVPKAN